MSLICSTTCGAAASLTPYWAACDGVQNLRKYGNNYLALIKCTLAIADPTSLVAWEAAVTNGDVVIYPVGKIDVPEPSVDTSNEVDACLTNVALRQTYTIPIITYQVKEDYSDHEFHEDIAENYSNWRAIWFDCNGAVTMADDYITYLRAGTGTALTSNPGFEFSVPAPPHPTEGDGGRMKWQWSIEIERSAGRIFKTTLFDGLLTAVQG